MKPNHTLKGRRSAISKTTSSVIALMILFGLRAQAQDSFLDNGTVRLGVDLSLGGAITYLSKSGDSLNLINSCDWGRQVQMSFYSGPVPFSVGEKQPRADWVQLGWNPIQAGDTFGHRGRVLEQTNDGRHIYVKSVPMQWPLDDVPGDCTFESWLELRGPCVVARGRLNNARADRTQYPARGQELPAVYTNAPFHRLITYRGARPFQNEPVTQLTAQPPPRWDMWLGTENWSALLNDAGWGLGVWNPRTIWFGGGFNGQPGPGGPKDAPCGYIAPHAVEILDHHITYDFEYELILGSVEEIRAEVYRHPRPADVPRWTFEKSRAGWHYLNAQDQGWPIKNELRIEWTHDDPQIISPAFFRAAKTRTLILEAASAQPARGAIYWSTLDRPGFSETRLIRFDFTADSFPRQYRIPLPEIENLTHLRIDPSDTFPGAIRLQSIALE
jgi:hypothetical protein